jgi:hypothetical protein
MPSRKLHDEVMEASQGWEANTAQTEIKVVGKKIYKVRDKCTYCIFKKLVFIKLVWVPFH